MLHIRDVEGPKKTGSMETRLEAMEQQVFKCEGMVERGLNANHMMITEFTNKHMIFANDIGKHLSRLYDRIDQLQAQIYDLQNQNSEAMEEAESSDTDTTQAHEDSIEGPPPSKCAHAAETTGPPPPESVGVAETAEGTPPREDVRKVRTVAVKLMVEVACREVACVAKT
ncbi:40S ribosomal protein S5-1 [Hordeum vulgare]|nr:40S ribosomal protein S5-1 [Hordeum vulgare]